MFNLYIRLINNSLFYLYFFFFNDTATTEIYTLSLHDALPIFAAAHQVCRSTVDWRWLRQQRSEEHTSELQSRENLVCRLLLEKKKKKNITSIHIKTKKKQNQSQKRLNTLHIKFLYFIIIFFSFYLITILLFFFFFFFNDTATTEIYTLSLHDALPISRRQCRDGVDRHLKLPFGP